jgi:hypothetical protein
MFQNASLKKRKVLPDPFAISQSRTAGVQEPNKVEEGDEWQGYEPGSTQDCRCYLADVMLTYTTNVSERA